VGPERGPLRLVSTIEDLLERKTIGFGLEIREYGRRDPSRRPRGILYPRKLALTCDCDVSSVYRLLMLSGLNAFERVSRLRNAILRKKVFRCGDICFHFLSKIVPNNFLVMM
jgi:hypothetical protein